MDYAEPQPVNFDAHCQVIAGDCPPDMLIRFDVSGRPPAVVDRSDIDVVADERVTLPDSVLAV
ncbi:MAG: hypothetical protein ACPHDT_15195, partial [Acidimicrobiales bacterium]